MLPVQCIDLPATLLGLVQAVASLASVLQLQPPKSVANLLCAVSNDPIELTTKQPVVYVRDKKKHVEKQLMATVSSTLLRSL